MRRDTSIDRPSRSDGTATIVLGAVIAGLASLTYEIIGARSLGTGGFAPVSSLLTLHFLAFVVILIPLEQVIIRRLTQDPDRPGVPVGALSLVLGTAGVAGFAGWALDGSLFDDDAWYAMLAAATILTHGLFIVGRGYLAGRHSYHRYGIASAAASLGRLAVAVVIILLVVDGRWFGLALVLGPLVIIALRPFGRAREAHVVDTAAVEGRLLSGMMLASATAQTLLLAGPVVAALLGADAATISILFATFTLMRAPLSLGNNVIARLVPPLTDLAEGDQLSRLTSIARKVAAATVAIAAIGVTVGAVAGPAVIGAVFGSEFRPQTAATALIVGGVIAAGGSLVIGQVFVARGDTGRLADSWLIAAGVAGIALAIPGPGVMTRVAVAFLSGEAAALGLLTIHATRPIRTSHPSRSERRWYGIAKRSFDLTTATLLLILTAPIAIFVATTIRVRSGSPVLLRQTRLGRNGRPFEMWKFRTMVLDADPAVFWQHIRDLAEAAGSESVPQPDLRIPDDPRLTSTGRSLRRWSLDELPNLVNVVFGDMSLVGPRPLLPEEVDLIRRQFGDAAADGRSSVAPGVTGLAQVEGRDDISMAERSHLDLQYVAERSMSLDLWLILRTVAGVFRYRGA